jgi:hypothetical protein
MCGKTQKAILKMDAFNSLVNVIRETIPVVQPGISAIVGGFVSAMFLRGNTQRKEFEKIRMGKIKDAIDDLVNSHELTLTELLKCKNLLKIAELADNEYKNKAHECTSDTNYTFDFDWFLRFFEAAGNISNEDMQFLWARILAGEVNQPGAFTLRTLETLRNMTQNEALLLQQLAQLVLIEGDGTKFIYRSNYDDFDAHETEINELYGIGAREFAMMEECGLLSSIKQDSYATLLDGTACIYNGNIILIFQSKTELDQNLETMLDYNCYMVTQTATQLIAITDVQPNDNYILDLGLFFRKKYPNFSITAHRIINVIDDNIAYDFNTDLLDTHENKI